MPLGSYFSLLKKVLREHRFQDKIKKRATDRVKTSRELSDKMLRICPQLHNIRRLSPSHIVLALAREGSKRVMESVFISISKGVGSISKESEERRT